MRIHKLSNFIFMNYLLLLIILLSTVWVAYSVTSTRTDAIYEQLDSTAIMNAFDAFETGGAQAYYDALRQEVGLNVSYFELVDENRTVLAQYQSPRPVGHTYSERDINRQIDDTNVLAFYPYETDEIALIGLHTSVVGDQVNGVLLQSIILYSIFVALLLLGFTRFTSRQIARPLETLTDAVDRITQGEYGHTTDFQNDTEIGQLKNAINTLSIRIHDEIQLRQSSEADRKNLILNISHDLKTPLTNIRGYAETLLRSQGDAAPELKNSLTVILNNSVRADQLLKDLFELSRLENPNSTFTLVTADLCELLRLILIDYVAELEARSIQLEVDIPTEPVLVAVNGDSFRRAVSNILNNAIRYVSGLPTPVIRVTLTCSEEEACLSIWNNGPAIEPDRLPHIFKPFITGNPSRNRDQDGSGLGLAIARSVVERHGGTISAEAGADHGAAFLLRLPVAEQELDQ